MKAVAIVTMILASFALVLFIVSCAAILGGVHNGVCQSRPQASACR